MVAIFEKKKKKKLLLQTACVEYQLGLLLLNMTNHNNHDNTATFCEIRNSVKILSGLHVVIEFLQFMDFGET